MGDDITIGVTEIVNNIEVTAQPNDQIVDISVTDNADNVTLNITPTVVEVNINKGGSFAKWGDLYGTLSDQTDLQNALNLKANLVGGKVPASELPSYVDDIIEVANYAALPATGEIGKIYVTLDNNKIYRWSGSVYIEIASNSAIWGAITGTLSSQTDLQNALNAKEPTITAGTTSQYWRGDKSWQTLDSSSVGLGNVNNTSDADKPISTATQTALNAKQAALTNPVTGTGTTNYIPKFTGSSAIGDSLIFDNGTNVGIGTITPTNDKLEILGDAFNLGVYRNADYNSVGPASSLISVGQLVGTTKTPAFDLIGLSTSETNGEFRLRTRNSGTMTEAMRILSNGNVLIGATTDAGYKLDVNGTGRFSGVATFNGGNIDGTLGEAILFGNATYPAAQKNRIRSSISASATGNLLVLEAGNGTTGSYNNNQLVLNGNGNVGIGTTDAGYKLDVNGTNRFQGYLNSNNCFERVFSQAISFPNGTANLAADVILGNLSFWGYIEVEVNSTYNDQNSTGKLTKVFAVGTNPGNLIYTNESRVVDSMGTIPDNIAIGDFSWNAGNSTYRIPISHIVSSNNVYTVKVRMFTSEDGAKRVFDGISIGNNYTLTALARQYVYYNDKVGFGTPSPSAILQANGSNSNGVIQAYVTAGGGSALRLNTNFVNNNYIDLNPYVTGVSNNGFEINQNGTQRLVISGGGNVLIGTTVDAGAKLQVNGASLLGGSLNSDWAVGISNTGTTNANGLYVNIGASSTGTPFAVYKNFSALFTVANSGAATFSSTVTATGFFNSSDNRLKDLIDYDYNVSDIKPITYLWKDGRDKKKHVGYSAQEVQKVMPDAVNEGADGFLSVNYVEVLVAKIEAMEKEIAYLKSK